MKKTKIKISKSKILLLLTVLILCTATVYAQSDLQSTLKLSTELSASLQKLLGGVSDLFLLILRLLQKILWPMFIAIGGLLNNDLIFGSGMEERLLGIWTQVRNLVNIGFVVVLLGIALYNVTGFAKDTYEIKTFLPKFAMALIAVNFSYVILKTALDVTNVLTTAIFAMPASIGKSLQYSSFVEPDPKNANNWNLKTDPETLRKINIVCKNLYGPYDDWNLAYAASNDAPNDTPEQKKAKADQRNAFICTGDAATRTYKFAKAGQDFFTQYSSRNAAMIIAIQFMNVVDVDSISAATLKKPDIMKMAFNLLFSIILYIVYGAAYVALFVVLLTRVVVLWMVIALSPVWALGVILPSLKESGGGDLQKQFIGMAVAPIKIAICLTIGYIMLDQLNQIKPTDLTLALDMKSINLETSAISNLQYMIVAFAAVAVVWIGVFKAAEGTAAAGMVGKIKGAVAGMGRYVGSMWRYLPIAPTGGGKRESYAQMMGRVKAPFEALRTRGEYQGTEKGAVTAPEIKRMTKKGQLQEATEDRNALGKPETQKAVYEKLSTLPAGEERQWGNKMLTKIKAKLPEEQFKLFQQGKLTSPLYIGQVKEILGKGYVPTTPAGKGAAAGTPAAGTKPAKGPQAPTPANAAEIENDFSQSKATNDDTWKKLKPEEQTKVNNWMTARTAAKSANDQTALKTTEDQLTNDPQLKSAVEAMAKVKCGDVLKSAAKPSTEAVTAKAGTAGAAARQTAVDTLRDVHNKLSERGVGDLAKRKEIIADALKAQGVAVEKLKNIKEFKDLL